MKFIVFLIFLVPFKEAFGQMLDNSNAELFSEDPKFNTSFILKNKIKSIKGHYSTKADYDRIRPTNNIYYYQFNEKGELSKDYKTTKRDTVVRSYEYNSNGYISVKRQSDQFGFHSYHFKYDSLNRLIEKEYRRDENATGSKIDFKLNKSFSISTEVYVYESHDRQLKKSYFNSLGRLYKIAFYYTDENNYLYKDESKSINGNSRSQTTYTYNENGFIKEKTSEKELGRKITTRIKFEYDKQNNILAQHYYRNGVYKTEFQIVYNSSNLLMSALLARDIETNVITILKFSEYSFFN
ncbi:MAG: hypothetical protein AB8B72_09165 [Crocinitomicaceae bacterium]